MVRFGFGDCWPIPCPRLPRTEDHREELGATGCLTSQPGQYLHLVVWIPGAASSDGWLTICKLRRISHHATSSRNLFPHVLFPPTRSRWFYSAEGTQYCVIPTSFQSFWHLCTVHTTSTDICSPSRNTLLCLFRIPALRARRVLYPSGRAKTCCNTIRSGILLFHDGPVRRYSANCSDIDSEYSLLRTFAANVNLTY